jgi:uncharacterized protein (TIGR02757 family)
MNHGTLWEMLEERVALYNTPDFILNDPISIPHRYTRLQDREIAGLWTAILSWGQRKTIVQKAGKLMDMMGSSPYNFILSHSERDREPFLAFKHRTFQPIDTLYFLEFLQFFYRSHTSLESAFTAEMSASDPDVGQGLAGFHKRFFQLDVVPKRTKKHVPTPVRNSSCKRLNMFLRWMVRDDDKGVDFGLWKNIRPSQLLIPLDVHVHRVAQRLGLLERKQSDWKATLELTETLRQFDPEDPVKYDYALFGMGVLEGRSI